MILVKFIGQSIYYFPTNSDSYVIRPKLFLDIANPILSWPYTDRKPIRPSQSLKPILKKLNVGHRQFWNPRSSIWTSFEQSVKVRKCFQGYVSENVFKNMSEPFSHQMKLFEYITVSKKIFVQVSDVHVTELTKFIQNYSFGVKMVSFQWLCIWIIDRKKAYVRTLRKVRLRKDQPFLPSNATHVTIRRVTKRI